MRHPTSTHTSSTGLEIALCMDYVSFTRKPLKTEPRSAFLGALGASPYVKLDKKNSTNDVKFFKFTDKFKELLEKCVHGTNGESYLQPNNFDVPSTSAMSNSTEAVASEEAPIVPDIQMEEIQTFSIPPPFFHDVNNLMSTNLQADCNANSIGIPQESQLIADTENTNHTLPPEEQSMNLNCPENYDPTPDFIQSLGRNQNAPGISANSFMVGGTPYKIHDVCSVKVEGNLVRKIQDKEPQSPSQTHYLLTIQPSF